MLDADIYGPSIPLMLGMKGTEMDVEMDQEKGKLVPPEYEGIKVVSLVFLQSRNIKQQFTEVQSYLEL